MCPELFVSLLAPAVCGAFLPQHASLVFTHLMMLLQVSSSPVYSEGILRLATSWLGRVGVAECATLNGTKECSLFTPVTRLVETGLAKHALCLLDLLTARPPEVNAP
jgi:hypothetical protein